MITDRYINPTILEYGVNVLAFVNPSLAGARGVVFTHKAFHPAFTHQATPHVFQSQQVKPLFGDNQI